MNDKVIYRSKFDKYIEPRISRLEKIVERLSRRSRKKMTALLTPYPISNAVFGEKVSGPILRYFFPCTGKVTKGAIVLGKRPKESVSLLINVKGDEEGRGRSFTLDRKMMTLDLNIEVREFDKLTASISYKESDSNVTEAWIGFLWVPAMRDVEAKSFLFKELENDLSKKEE